MLFDFAGVQFGDFLQLQLMSQHRLVHIMLQATAEHHAERGLQVMHHPICDLLEIESFECSCSVIFVYFYQHCVKSAHEFLFCFLVAWLLAGASRGFARSDEVFDLFLHFGWRLGFCLHLGVSRQIEIPQNMPDEDYFAVFIQDLLVYLIQQSHCFQAVEIGDILQMLPNDLQEILRMDAEVDLRGIEDVE